MIGRSTIWGLIGIAALSGLACKKQASPASDAGMLACSETMIVPSDSLESVLTGTAKITVDNCPLVVAGDPVVRRDGKYFQAIGQNGYHGLIRKDSALIFGSFQFSGKFIAFTAGLVPEMAQTATAGVLAKVEKRGIILFKNGILDTLYPGRYDTPFIKSMPESTLQTCMDRIRKSEVVGLVSGGFLPAVACEFELPGYWTMESDGVRKFRLKKTDSAIHIASLISIGKRKGFPNSFWAEFATSVGTLWIFSPTQGSSLAVVPLLEYPPRIVKIEIQKLNPDSVPDFVVETLHHFGDGAYSQLSVLKSSLDTGIPEWSVIPLRGYSGEGGGQDLGGAWCIDSSDSKAVLFLLRQEKEGTEYSAGVYAFGPMGFGRSFTLNKVLGLAFSEPTSMIPAESDFARWRRIGRANLCLLPGLEKHFWYVGKLFLGESERIQWISRMSGTGIRIPKEFVLRPLGNAN